MNTEQFDKPATASARAARSSGFAAQGRFTLAAQIGFQGMSRVQCGCALDMVADLQRTQGINT